MVLVFTRCRRFQTAAASSCCRRRKRARRAASSAYRSASSRSSCHLVLVLCSLTRRCVQELEQNLAESERTLAEQRKDIALHIGVHPSFVRTSRCMASPSRRIFRPSPPPEKIQSLKLQLRNAPPSQPLATATAGAAAMPAGTYSSTAAMPAAGTYSSGAVPSLSMSMAADAAQGGGGGGAAGGAAAFASGRVRSGGPVL